MWRGGEELSRSEVIARLQAGGSVFADEEAELLMDQFSGVDLEEAVLDRAQGEPLEHILGWVEFAGLKIGVLPGVFVPRRRTVLLLEQALARLPRHGLLVELCCGAAAVSTAVAHGRADVTVFASDIDETAVMCAQENLTPHGGCVAVGDIDEAVPAEFRGRVDVVVANAPYVPTSQLDLMPAEARDYEPVRALDGGTDGTRIQDRVFEAARSLLGPDGVVVVETSRPQAETTASRLLWRGFLPQIILDEELDATCVVGRRSPV